MLDLGSMIFKKGLESSVLIHIWAAATNSDPQRQADLTDAAEGQGKTPYESE